jgi:hypothetical protein
MFVMEAVFKNYTPNAVTLCLDDGTKLFLPSLGEASVVEDTVPVCNTDKCPIYYILGSRVINLPDEEDGTLFIVEKNVAMNSGRSDTLYPHHEGEKIIGLIFHPK